MKLYKGLVELEWRNTSRSEGGLSIASLSLIPLSSGKGREER
jgi:hypothetical protein